MSKFYQNVVSFFCFFDIVSHRRSVRNSIKQNKTKKLSLRAEIRTPARRGCMLKEAPELPPDWKDSRPDMNFAPPSCLRIFDKILRRTGYNNRKVCSIMGGCRGPHFYSKPTNYDANCFCGVYNKISLFPA